MEQWRKMGLSPKFGWDSRSQPQMISEARQTSWIIHDVSHIYWTIWDLLQCAQRIWKNQHLSKRSPRNVCWWMLMVFWYFLVDFSRDAWLHAFELRTWECWALDGHAWLSTPT
jgi:hypothetical protein